MCVLGYLEEPDVCRPSSAPHYRCAAPGPAAFWSWKPFFSQLLCNDASSPCQYFNALIDVSSLIVPNNLKWAFKHSYWNIDVLCCLVESSATRGRCSLLSFLEITWPRQECGFSTNKDLQKHEPGWRIDMQPDIQPASYPTKVILGSLKQQIPSAGDNSLLKEELSSGSHQSSPVYMPHYTDSSELPLMDAGLLLAQSSNKAAQKWKAVHESPGHAQCPQMAHGWNEGWIQLRAHSKWELRGGRASPALKNHPQSSSKAI